MDYFSVLPPEIQLSILAETNPNSLVKLCQTSSQYTSICSEKYNYLWRILIFDLIQPTRNYIDIREYNDLNNTQFNTWFEVYVYFYTLPIDDTLDTRNRLIELAENGNLEAVKYMIEHGSDSYRTLTFASRSGNLSLVQYLIQRGENVHEGDDEPLIWAVYNNDLDIVKYLVNQGANIRVNEDQPLGIAYSRGYTDIVNYLLQQGAIMPEDISRFESVAIATPLKMYRPRRG